MDIAYKYYIDSDFNIVEIKQDEPLDISSLPIVSVENIEFAEIYEAREIEYDSEETDTASEGEEPSGETPRSALRIESMMTINEDLNQNQITFLDSSFEKVMASVKRRDSSDSASSSSSTITDLTLQEKLFIGSFEGEGEEAPTFTCNACFRSFSKRGYLTQHQTAVHTIKPFQCGKCSKRFAIPKALELHIAKHKNKTMRRFGCDLCPKRYVYKADLKIHKLNQHNIHERLHECECGKKFARRDHFLNHLVTHRKIVK